MTDGKKERDRKDHVVEKESSEKITLLVYSIAK